MKKEDRVELFVQTYPWLGEKNEAMRRDLVALIDQLARLLEEHNPEKSENFRRDLIELLDDVSRSELQPNPWAPTSRAIEL